MGHHEHDDLGLSAIFRAIGEELSKNRKLAEHRNTDTAVRSIVPEEPAHDEGLAVPDPHLGRYRARGGPGHLLSRAPRDHLYHLARLYLEFDRHESVATDPGGYLELGSNGLSGLQWGLR